jgi:steroid delta-isomerase-like uncharacterized protein
MNTSRMRKQLLAASFAIVAVLGSLGSRASADPTDLAQAWTAAWNSHDVNAVAALFTEDALYEDVPTSAVNRGTGQLRAFAQFFLTTVPDLKVELVNSAAQSDLKGGHGVIEWIFSGTDQGLFKTGKKFSVRGVTVFDVAGGKIARNSDYWDLATMLRQLGLLPKGL